MEQRADLGGRQVKCLIASEGHLWMRNYFDRFPSAVRRRLAESTFNICPACMDEEARRAAFQRRETKPSIATYFTTITAIERKLGHKMIEQQLTVRAARRRDGDQSRQGRRAGGLRSLQLPG